MTEPVLELDRVTKTFRSGWGRARNVLAAMRDVTFEVGAGETVGLVGESGSGKSTTGLASLGLITPTSGRVRFGGAPYGKPRDRVGQVQAVLQNPHWSLNPRLRVGDSVAEPLAALHRGALREHADAVAEMLDQVGLEAAFARRYPHELSGGQRQRVMIAIALACNPRLLIADEPTTALDVTVQAEVLDLMERLRVEHDMAMVIITHDMGVVAQVADDVAVMYAGQIVEQAGAEELFDHPEHPYTEALLAALPRADRTDVRTAPLAAIPGQPPNLIAPPPGCRFAPRCAHAERADGCATEPPELREIRPGHQVRTAHPACVRVAGGVA